MASSSGLSESELAAYRGYFWKQDSSGDGRLNFEEFHKMMESMGVKLNPRYGGRSFAFLYQKQFTFGFFLIVNRSDILFFGTFDEQKNTRF